MRTLSSTLIALVVLSVAACAGDSASAPASTPAPYEVTTTVVSGDYTQDIWVTAPDGPDADDWGSWPLVYALHGLGGTGEGLTRTAEELASHGVVVFAPDYRSTGELSQMEMDGECGYRYALSIAEEHGADLSQPITYFGHSFGASIVLFGGLVEEPYGPGGDYDVCYTGAPRPDVIVAVAGCHYGFEGESYDFDTSGYENEDATIVLVAGTDDATCQAWQSEDATDALVAAGYDATLVEIEGGDHANVIFFEIEGDEWLEAPADPIGIEVAQVVLDAIAAASA